MKQAFQEFNFRADTLDTIGTANEIIEEYQDQGFMLTLRQLYYQFVARDLISNSDRSYKRLGSVVNNGRLAGLIDWSAIEDRTRSLSGIYHDDDPAEVLLSAADGYCRDLWADQDFRVEVWIEKEALAGVISNVCWKLDIPYFSCRGYVSQSEQYKAGRRLQSHIYNGQEPVILHLGDHDPSGIDMTRDNKDRLSMFACEGVTVRRIALNFDQIEELNPPPNPAKLTDSRVTGYIEKFGSSSWELDALEPKYIAALIEREVGGLIDPEKMSAARALQKAEREKIREFARKFEV